MILIKKKIFKIGGIITLVVIAAGVLYSGIRYIASDEESGEEIYDY